MKGQANLPQAQIADSSFDKRSHLFIGTRNSHGIGLIAALIGAPILLFAARDTGSGVFFVGMIVFIAAMLALYLASTLYHVWPETRTKYALQVFDHCAIFLLIARGLTRHLPLVRFAASGERRSS
jgi:channel protein (hemolysin III family)